MLSTETFISWAKEAGFAEVGFCSLDPFEGSREIVASQKPLSERRQLRFSPENDLPDAKSLAILLWPYAPALPGGKTEIFVDSYYQASNAAYHAALRLEDRMLKAGGFAKANVSYPAKAAAVRAGMGVIGLNSLLITPAYGSRVVIILMATGIQVQKTVEPEEAQPCSGCGKCVSACPSGALDAHGMSHPERCLRNFMMEGVVVPEELRSKIGMRMIGCDICQRVCPMQTMTAKRKERTYFLKDFLSNDPAVFSREVSILADEIGRNTARPQRIRAQAALLAGNAKDKAYLPTLRQWAQMPFEAVSMHALWAIEQIDLTDNDT